MKLVEMRINDRRILKLVRKLLQAGVMEGLVRISDLGTFYFHAAFTVQLDEHIMNCKSLGYTTIGLSFFVL